MKTLEDYLQRDAELYPDKVAVICGEEACTYRQLWGKVKVRQQKLSEKDGSLPSSAKNLVGKIIPFLSSQTIDFLVDYFAIHLAGGIAVPLEQGMPDEVFLEYQKRLAGSDAQELPMGNNEDIADILFTTGTTGKSKGVLISYSTIIADAENLIEAQGYHHDLTFIINGPLNHIGSLSKIYPVILVGATLHIIDGMKDLNAFFGAMDGGAGTFATFLVPASIRMLLAFAKDRLASCADNIEFIETGAAPISQTDMEQLCSTLPKTRLYNTYASTETGIIATYDFNHGECLAGCLGKPMKHSQLWIVDEQGKRIEDAMQFRSSKGKVACSGKTLMSGYYNDEVLTHSVLRDGTIYTSDLGFIDSKGRLRLQGRDGDVINVGGYKVSPVEIEDAALSLPMVKDCICIPAQHRVLGTVLKLLVVLNEGCELDKRQLALSLREKLEPYKVPMQYEAVASIKRTFNGKIDRKAYML